jgi:hypothetical protein
MKMPSNYTPIYTTRIVHQDFHTNDVANNRFTTERDAKKYLEGYIDVRYGLPAGEWEADELVDEKWTMQLPDLDARAVVRRARLWTDAEVPLSRLRESLQPLREKREQEATHDE